MSLLESCVCDGDTMDGQAVMWGTREEGKRERMEEKGGARKMDGGRGFLLCLGAGVNR